LVLAFCGFGVIILIHLNLLMGLLVLNIKISDREGVFVTSGGIQIIKDKVNG
jgi:hypothetical protein